MADQSFDDVINQIRAVIERFKKIEGKDWGVEGAVIELTKQVGQLSALVMNREGYYYSNRDQEDRQYQSTDLRIADELADIFTAVVRIADHYDIDLAEANRQARSDEEVSLKSKGV